MAVYIFVIFTTGLIILLLDPIVRDLLSRFVMRRKMYRHDLKWHIVVRKQRKFLIVPAFLQLLYVGIASFCLSLIIWLITEWVFLNIFAITLTEFHIVYIGEGISEFLLSPAFSMLIIMFSGTYGTFLLLDDRIKAFLERHFYEGKIEDYRRGTWIIKRGSKEYFPLSLFVINFIYRMTILFFFLIISYSAMEFYYLLIL